MDESPQMHKSVTTRGEESTKYGKAGQDRWTQTDSS
jgi:hypothetical protein